MNRFATSLLLLLLTGPLGVASQDAPSPAGRPSEHVLGTITAVDPAAHTVTVKDDKSGADQLIVLTATKTLLKVPPGAKDLKNFTRITADELAVGDRVDVRGSKPADDPSRIAARSLVLMSGRDLQAAHQAQAAEWQNATAGVVSAVDPAAQKITIAQRTPEGPKTVVLEVSPQTEFTRYSPDSPGSPVASQLGQVQPGDQVRVVGAKSGDGATISAKRVYSGAFRTWNGTVLSVAPDGKQISIKDLASKKPISLALNDNSTVRKLSPEWAARLAQRLNGPRATAGEAGQEAPANVAGPANGGAAQRGPRNGDISQMIDRLPTIAITDLKPGDAVVVSGVISGAGPAIATHIIAGVEPILQSAPAGQRGQAIGGDWGLGEMAVPQ